jgi:hypothetical protein
MAPILEHGFESPRGSNLRGRGSAALRRRRSRCHNPADDPEKRRPIGPEPESLVQIAGALATACKPAVDFRWEVTI